ncbi:MAG TPA: glycosyltransferase family 1 protein [Pyrinomonadaceae bacterium]|nr:glycosyltransferase family 1 protein [Pyrinomonadaceae bacterium]
MRIGIDGYPLVAPKTGVGHYTLELAKALAQLCPDHSFELISPTALPDEVTHEVESFPNLRAVCLKPTALKRRWWAIGLPGYVRQAGLDLFHGTNYEVPLWNRQRNIVTVHDLSVFKYPETHDPRIARRARRRLPIMLRSASRIITPTEIVRDELAAQFKIAPASIAVTPEAPRSSFFPIALDDAAATRHRFEIEDDFILFVGTIEPRKNLEVLLRAFARILNETKHRPQLVIAGGEGWLNENFNRLVRTSDFGNRLRFTGYVNDQDLRALYSSCKVFVYPSLYEGFGLPPLEAMACGAPVIASRIPTHQETLKDKALLVSPVDEAALAKAIVELLENDSARLRLVQNGREYAATFSWQKTAALTFTVYEEVLRNSHK